MQNITIQSSPLLKKLGNSASLILIAVMFGIRVIMALVSHIPVKGGAAGPVEDFPAIVIMTSGITDLLSYLMHAFPLFALTSVVLITVWGMKVKKESDDGAIRQLTVTNLKSQYKNIEIRFDVLIWLAVIFGVMLIAWSFIPQKTLPPEIIAAVLCMIS